MQAGKKICENEKKRVSTVKYWVGTLPTLSTRSRDRRVGYVGTYFSYVIRQYLHMRIKKPNHFTEGKF